MVKNLDLELNRIHSSEYQRSTAWGCKYIGICCKNSLSYLTLNLFYFRRSKLTQFTFFLVI